MKHILLLFLLCFSISLNAQSPVTMPGTVFVVSPSGACLGCPGEVWMNEANCGALDGQSASVALQQNGFCFQSTCFTSRNLLATGFGFSIPGAATITGIELDLWANGSTGATIKDSLIQLLDAGTATGSNYAQGSTWGTTISQRNYGGASDLWGTSWTPAQINNSQFGVLIKMLNLGSNPETAYVDYLELTIHYTVCNFTLSETHGNVVCHGDSSGTAAIHIMGSGSPFTISWSPYGGSDSTAAQLFAGNYSVSVSESGGCTDSITVSITEPAEILVQFFDSICSGDSLFAGGGWQSGDGVFSDTLSSGMGCDSIVETHLTVHSPTTVSLSLSLADTLCNDAGSQALSGGNPSGGIYSGSGVSAGNFDPVVAGVGWHVITYTFSDSNGCSGSARDSVFVEVCDGRISDTDGFGVSLSPNPAHDKMTLAFEDAIQSETRLSMMDLQGRVLYQTMLNPGEKKFALDVQSLTNGMYLWRMETENGKTISGRFVKE